MTKEILSIRTGYDFIGSKEWIFISWKIRKLYDENDWVKSY